MAASQQGLVNTIVWPLFIACHALCATQYRTHEAAAPIVQLPTSSSIALVRMWPDAYFDRSTTFMIQFMPATFGLYAPQPNASAGVLAWFDSMAHQLMPEMSHRLAAADSPNVACQILGVWQHLVMGLHARIPTPEFAAMALLPGVVRLAQRLALHSPHGPPPAAGCQAAEWQRPRVHHELILTSCLDAMGCFFASVVVGHKEVAERRWGSAAIPNSSSSSSSRDSMLGCFSAEQTDALKGLQVSLTHHVYTYRCGANAPCRVATAACTPVGASWDTGLQVLCCQPCAAPTVVRCTSPCTAAAASSSISTTSSQESILRLCDAKHACETCCWNDLLLHVAFP